MTPSLEEYDSPERRAERERLEREKLERQKALEEKRRQKQQMEKAAQEIDRSRTPQQHLKGDFALLKALYSATGGSVDDAVELASIASTSDNFALLSLQARRLAQHGFVKFKAMTSDTTVDGTVKLTREGFKAVQQGLDKPSIQRTYIKEMINVSGDYTQVGGEGNIGKISGRKVSIRDSFNRAPGGPADDRIQNALAALEEVVGRVGSEEAQGQYELLRTEVMSEKPRKQAVKAFLDALIKAAPAVEKVSGAVHDITTLFT